jgi:hypothetical protein
VSGICSREKERREAAKLARCSLDHLVGNGEQTGREGEARPVEVLFELDCDDQLAGDVEWNLADLFGYDRGPHYATSNWAVKVPREQCSKNMKERWEDPEFCEKHRTSMEEEWSGGR